MSKPLTVGWHPVGAGPFGTVLRPTVPVQLAAFVAPDTGTPVGTLALIDSGSDFTIASISMLERLGIDLKDCECQFDDVNGGGSLTYRHPAELVIEETFTIRFDSLQFRGWHLWKVSRDVSMVLGSNDVMRFLKVTLDYGVTTLEPREPGVTEWRMPHDVLEPAA